MANIYINAALKQNVPPTVQHVLTALANRVNNKGTCQVRVTRLIEDTKLGRSTIFKAINALVKQNLLTRTPTFRSDGSQSASIYTLLLDVAEKTTAAVKKAMMQPIKMNQVFNGEPLTKPRGHLILDYNNKEWAETAGAVFKAVEAKFPYVQYAYDTCDALLDIIEDQLEFWMLRARESKGRLKLTKSQIIKAFLKFESSHLSYLNHQGNLRVAENQRTGSGSSGFMIYE